MNKSLNHLPDNVKTILLWLGRASMTDRSYRGVFNCRRRPCVAINLVDVRRIFKPDLRTDGLATAAPTQGHFFD
jgi:hypothetical protein